ncbi:MAG: hypothetical protein SFY80_06895 [Verrucomicrobiota bacterium]|nr:hypothetical protein [Verrucomicrobiota bacterium]
MDTSATIKSLLILGGLSLTGVTLLATNSVGPVWETGAYDPTSTTFVPPGSGSTTTPRMFWYPEHLAFRAGYLNASNAGYWSDSAIGDYSFGFGIDTLVPGDGAYAFGNNIRALGIHSFAFGKGTTSPMYASGNYSFAFGEDTFSSSAYTFAFGKHAQAAQTNAVAFGENSYAYGASSLAVGKNTTANGTSSVALGESNYAGSDYSFVAGYKSKTFEPATNSAAIGTGLVANHRNAFVTGMYNSNTDTNLPAYTDFTSPNRPLFLVGNGSGDINANSTIEPSETSNAFYITAAGNAWLKGNLIGTGIRLGGASDIAPDAGRELVIAPTSGTTAGIALQHNGVDTVFLKSDSSSRLTTLGANGGSYLAINNTNGKVGIGTTTPSSTLDVNGSITLSGGARWIQAGTGAGTYANDTHALSIGTQGATGGNSGNLNLSTGSSMGQSGNIALTGGSSSYGVGGSIQLTAGSGGAVGGSVTMNPGTGSSVNGNIILSTIASGKVGIGTSTPTEKLSVAGKATLTTNSGSGGAVSPGPLLLENSGTGDTGLALKRAGQLSGTEWQLFQSSDANKFKIGRNTVADYLTIATTGNVGIGTNNPTGKLDVAGDIRVNGTPVIDATGKWVGSLGAINSTGAITSLTGQITASSSNPYLYLDGTYADIPNKAAIGVRSAGEVVMSSNTNNPNIPNWEVKFGSGTLGSPKDDSFYIGRATTGSITDFFHINQSGNVGIGTSTPTQALDVVGNAKVSGSLSAVSLNIGGENVIDENAQWVGAFTAPTVGVNDTFSAHHNGAVSIATNRWDYEIPNSGGTTVNYSSGVIHFGASEYAASSDFYRTDNLWSIDNVLYAGVSKMRFNHGTSPVVTMINTPATATTTEKNTVEVASDTLITGTLTVGAGTVIHSDGTILMKKQGDIQMGPFGSNGD